MNLKSQSAIEFIILIGAVLFIFISLSLVFQQNLREKNAEKRNQEVFNLAKSVQQEIDLAAISSDGYQRTFTLPSRIIKADYNVTLIDNFVYIKTLDNRHALSLPVKNLSGQIQKGNNIIRKINGTVFLNQ